MPQWNETTRRKLGTVVYHVLEQSGYIESARKPRLQVVHVASEVIRYLTANDESYVLRCIQAGP